ncbi:hypothetical protein [Thiohalorhabdus methylotrophus]|uniref:Uncharacterized protein n=1 Tax=Thiohalorhabdus methylotrophus TaxID=3242694 RepID=A0ABV4TTW7_9GAMM
MCVCESDLVKMKLHLITRRHYPGIRYNEEALGRIAKNLGIRFEREIRDLDGEQQADLAAAVFLGLPEGAPREPGPTVEPDRQRKETTPT